MKRTTILTTLLLAAITASAQVKKPAPVKYEQLVEDTTTRMQSYKDMAQRIQAVNNLLFIIDKPGDVTPSQRAYAIKNADSLQRLDIAWYNRIQALKQAIKPKDTPKIEKP